MKKILCVFMFSLFLSSGTASALLVPDPGTTYTCYPNIGCTSDATIDGLPVAYLHDEMWTYSAKLLDAMQDRDNSLVPVETYGVYDFATGTGGLDVILYTGAGTKNRNSSVGPDGPDPGNKGDYSFEDPVSAPKGSGGKTDDPDAPTTLNGWWGQNDQDNDGTADSVNGGVTVQNLYNYLFDLTGETNPIPALYMDMNQIGQTNDFLISGEIYLANPSNPQGDNTIGDDQYWWTFDEWEMTLEPNDALDTSTPNHVYDPTYPTHAPGQITYPGTSGDYVLDHNLGSGKPDYIGYFPTLTIADLIAAGYADWWFVVHMDLAGLNDGFEEIFLTGLYKSDAAPVPEPATMLLLGTGLVGVAGAARRKKKNQA